MTRDEILDDIKQVIAEVQVHFFYAKERAELCERAPDGLKDRLSAQYREYVKVAESMFNYVKTGVKTLKSL